MSTRLDRDVDPWADAAHAMRQLQLDRDPQTAKINAARITCAEYVLGHDQGRGELSDYLDALGIGIA